MIGLRRAAVVGLALGLVGASSASAQTPMTRVEVGAQAVAASFKYPGRAPGFGASFDVNVAPRLALEARVLRIDWRGNPALQLAAGIRAMFVRTRVFGFYGFALPGVYHLKEFHETLTTPNGNFESIPHEAHYVFDFGAGGEFVVSPRLLVRVELVRDIHAEADVKFPSGSPLALESTFIGSTWNLTAGVSYRGGTTLARPASRTSFGRWTIGPQLGVTVATGESGIGSVGGFAAFRALPYCDIETSVSTWVGSGLTTTFYEGGRMRQALIGAKVGVREGRVGVFFKIRTGVNSYGNVERCCPLRSGRSTVAALDLGGVIEFATSRHFVIRTDIGETLSFVPDPVLPGSDSRRTYSALYTLPAQVGFGWRF